MCNVGKATTFFHSTRTLPDDDGLLLTLRTRLPTAFLHYTREEGGGGLSIEKKRKGDTTVEFRVYLRLVVVHKDSKLHSKIQSYLISSQITSEAVLASWQRRQAEETVTDRG